MPDIHRDLTRSTLAVLAIFALLGMSVWVLRPFLGAAVWAAMIVIATWPLYMALTERLKGRRGLAIGVLLLGMLLLVVAPLVLAVDTVLDHADAMAEAFSGWLAGGLPPPPAWLRELPLVGEKAYQAWVQAAAAGSQSLLAKLTPDAAAAGRWVLAQLGGVGQLLVQFFLILVIAGVFYGAGEEAARLARRIGRRLAGARGESSVVLAAQAIRAVALGVGLTAMVQTLLGVLGLLVAGIPLASLLAALLLLLCLAQIGPLPVLLGAAGWMYWEDATGWAIFLALWGLLVAGLDNFLRPALIRRGADLPLLLVFAGVIGGMLGFGLVGIFIGPVVLAVAYTLLLSWLDDVPAQTGA